jgi:hypothetical protein
MSLLLTAMVKKGKNILFRMRGLSDYFLMAYALLTIKQKNN